MAKGDAQILKDRNAALKTNYKSINDYLTDNGRFKVGDANYKRRLTFVENARGTAKREAFTKGGKWSDYISSKYGWLIDIYNTVPEIAQIIRDGYVKDKPIEDIQRDVANSKWALGLQVGEYDYLKGYATNDRSYLDSVSAKERDVRGIAAQSGYTLDDRQIKILAAGALKAGWTPQQLNDEIGKSVVSAAQTGTPVTAAAPSDATPTGLQKTTDAASLRTLARSYGLNLTDQTVEGYVQSIVQGNLSVEQIKSQFREQAKSLYPSLAKQLDIGSVDDVTQSYRNIAANVLNIDPAAVDFSDATKYGKLLTYQDPKTGESRLMNATEWTQYLRGLPDWQNTKEAKDSYSGIIDTVTTLFGKVR